MQPFDTVKTAIKEWVINVLEERILSMAKEILMGVLMLTLIFFVTCWSTNGKNAALQKDYAKCMNIL